MFSVISFCINYDTDFRYHSIRIWKQLNLWYLLEIQAKIYKTDKVGTPSHGQNKNIRRENLGIVELDFLLQFFC